MRPSKSRKSWDPSMGFGWWKNDRKLAPQMRILRISFEFKSKKGRKKTQKKESKSEKRGWSKEFSVRELIKNYLENYNRVT